MKILKRETTLFFLALSFLSRIPTPKINNVSDSMLQQMLRYFPLVGFFIGLLCAVVFCVSQIYFGPNIAALLSVIFGLVITGAFHEDGLADTMDGFGGGYTVEKKLAIMKDSRVGTFGVVSLWAVLSLKTFSIAQLAIPMLGIVLAQSLSRFNAVLLMMLLPYVQQSETSKIATITSQATSSDDKPSDELSNKASKNMNAKILFISALFLAVFIAYNLSLFHVFVLLIAMSVTLLFCYYWCLSQIKGYTGDTLGACQQISEIVIYLTLLIIVGAM